jgi:lipopolysaccharide cholinephosphotransferase
VNNLSLQFADRRQECSDLPKLRQIQLVQLRILKIFDAVCREHNVSYWLDWGTLLGCVRHGGFIPWDDDLDVAMTREEYEKFEHISNESLPDGLFLQTIQSDPCYPFFFPKLRDNYSNTNDLTGKACHKGIYIDIFIYDKIPTSNILAYIQRRLYKILIAGRFQNERPIRQLFAKLLYWLRPTDELKDSLLQMHTWLGSFCYRLGLDNSAFQKHSHPESEIFPLGSMIFENIQVPVPNDWHGYLSKRYGNYMELPPEQSRVPSHCKLDEVKVFEPCCHPMALKWTQR